MESLFPIVGKVHVRDIGDRDAHLGNRGVGLFEVERQQDRARVAFVLVVRHQFSLLEEPPDHEGEQTDEDEAEASRESVERGPA